MAVTHGADQYVAYKVHRPRRRRQAGIGLLVGSAVSLGAGIGTDVALARDGRDGPGEYAPVAMYAAAGVAAVAGVVLLALEGRR